ncbi:hypothetical protein [Actinophytocola algeriensis]|uniref:Uncharacterized protein n=1 Tax=Actinophytocola algeriensis TaxID=1768010 RepID=A0A7W7Q5G1_9PSEU|nr:hypothetical protein [Actinophytocola algeriensis]MBB4907405.1 hypothetical protein [Actinophytocola algeriensis]MBE1479435.1 hypothetical protein [Actinophytocola algeriensis]
MTLIKCTPGYPMSMAGHTYVFGGANLAALGSIGSAHRPVIVERKRVVGELTAARVQTQTIDFPCNASAPPHERRP